jgi:hypothetical protein
MAPEQGAVTSQRNGKDERAAQVSAHGRPKVLKEHSTAQEIPVRIGHQDFKEC